MDNEGWWENNYMLTGAPTSNNFRAVEPEFTLFNTTDSFRNVCNS